MNIFFSLSGRVHASGVFHVAQPHRDIQVLLGAVEQGEDTRVVLALLRRVLHRPPHCHLHLLRLRLQTHELFKQHSHGEQLVGFQFIPQDAPQTFYYHYYYGAWIFWSAKGFSSAEENKKIRGRR